MARLRDRLVAHGDLFDRVLGSAQRDGAAVTFLFAGPGGVGKRFAARALAQALLCETDPAGCGRCGSCLRAEAGQHEALLEVAPEGTQIKIDQAREVIEFLRLSRIGRARVVIVDQAHLLNPQSANALLKVFEEPPDGTFIVLLAPSTAALTATLRSRARPAIFRALTAEELGRLQPAPEWALRAARGSLDRLRDLLDPAAGEIRAGAAQLLERLFGDANLLTGGDWRDLVKEKGNFPRILFFWTAFARDGLLMHAQGEKFLMNPDQKNLMAAMAKLPRPLIETFVERCLKIESELGTNRDAQLAVEELFVHLRDRRKELAS